MLLTDTAIRNAKPDERLQKLFDGDGLYLLIKPSSAKLWRFKYRIRGREKLLSATNVATADAPEPPHGSGASAVLWHTTVCR